MDKKITKHFLAFFVSLVTYTFSISLQADVLSKSFEYIFALSKNDFTLAHVNRKLDASVNKLTFTSHAYPVGFAALFIGDTITEQTILKVHNNAPIPQSYSYTKSNSGEIKKQFHIIFDWQNKVATDNRVTKPFTLTNHTFDALSFQLALAKAIQQQQADLTFTLIDNKQSRSYTLKNQGKEQLDTEAGQFNTVKVEYFDKVKKRQVIIWCAQQLDYLPVQIKRIDNDGDYGTLKLISLKPKTEVKSEENSNDF